MRFEQPENSTREQEKQRAIEQLLERASVVDQGADGVILKISAEEYGTQELQNLLELFGIAFEGETAVKLLKIFHAGSIEREYSFQKRAYNTLGSGNEECAGTPLPLAYSVFTVTDLIQERLPELARSASGELMIMEFVPGIDLERRLYHKALGYIEPTNVPELHHTVIDPLRAPVNIHLGMAIVDEATRSAAHLRENNAENRKLMAFLRRNGAHIHPSVLLQLEEAIIKLRRAGVVHNDLHARNIVIDGDIFDPNAKIQVYIIDYGRSKYTEESGLLRDDEIVDLLQRNSPAYEQAAQVKKQQKAEERQLRWDKKKEVAQQHHAEVLHERTIPTWQQARVSIWSSAAKKIENINHYTEQKIYQEILQEILTTAISTNEREVRIMDIFGMLQRYYPSNTQRMQFSRSALMTALEKNGIPRSRIFTYLDYYSPES
jgi:tRNA A-37 threonylcarbamoyl transferase component Bud32